MILVTGGAGFIGSNFVREWLASSAEPVLNLDKLTYAANLDNLAEYRDDARHVFVQGDICDQMLVRRLFDEYRPRAVVHFAAESHVDRSILGPGEFVRTNIDGTYVLLEAARAYWQQGRQQSRQEGVPEAEADAYPEKNFRFLHVSTDEVYGSLERDDPPFSETTSYQPNSPYSASKAAADHLVRAWHHTYGLPTLITNCSNNYGPYQFPEKLIPLVIANALAGKPLPIYGDGLNIRDWLYVGDHCAALRTVLAQGEPGQTWNIGGWNECANIDIVRKICELLDVLHPDSPVVPHAQLITFVQDRPGHDRRYAIDARKIERELGWRPVETFETGLRKTVEWVLAHEDWMARVQTGTYREWMERQYGSERHAN